VPHVSDRPTADLPDEDWTGRRLEVQVGPVAHGGHCVARYSGRVVFVRHALPGEQVSVLVTEDRGGSFCRGDAVEVHEPAPDRVEPPCPHAHPGGCGGCDFQHVSPAGQRRLKAAVVTEQLARLAGIDRPVEVRPLVEDETGLGWRRRIRYAVGDGDRLGLREHRSHRVIPLQDCPLGAPGVGDADALARRWPGYAEVEIAADDTGGVAVVGHRERPTARLRSRRASPRQPGRAARPRTVAEHLQGPERLDYRVGDLQFDVQAGGFWQTHPAAAAAFVAAVRSAAQVRPGERVLDLYAGAGLFSVALADQVGRAGAVLALESDPRAAADAAANLAGFGWASVRTAPVTPAILADAATQLGVADVVVLDPPRTGAGRDVLTAILQGGPRVVVYVACDPAALARDLRAALELDWQLDTLDAVDAFPMTHHVECIAVLRPPASPV
jgi:tRNA/tmRNA/rRNA uracil-C5-methylase (TrmA/RlmC/RlmD family)